MRQRPDAKRDGLQWAVIVGNASSVDSIDDEFWTWCCRSDVLLVGTNRVLCFERLASVSWDCLVIRDNYRKLWQDQKWGEKYHAELWQYSNAWKVGPACDRATFCDEYLRFIPSWVDSQVSDTNGELAVMRNSSVVIQACNWAWLCGVKNLVLIGVDYCGSHARMHKPYSDAQIGWPKQYAAKPSAVIEGQFSIVRGAIEASGGAIMNVSDGSALRALPQSGWHAVMEM